MYRMGFDHILGIRPSYEGLVVDPVIPRVWKAFKAERVFRGARYLIEVENPDGVESGVKSIRVDGRPVPGTVLPLAPGTACRVLVTMGAPGSSGKGDRP
jgi:cellobiose phosphorylase